MTLVYKSKVKKIGQAQFFCKNDIKYVPVLFHLTSVGQKQISRNSKGRERKLCKIKSSKAQLIEYKN